jgi:hypothetical protein
VPSQGFHDFRTNLEMMGTYCWPDHNAHSFRFHALGFCLTDPFLDDSGAKSPPTRVNRHGERPLIFFRREQQRQAVGSLYGHDLIDTGGKNPVSFRAGWIHDSSRRQHGSSMNLNGVS